MDELKRTILITGANGFLGQKLIEKLIDKSQYHIVATSKSENRNFIREGYTYRPCNFTDSAALQSLLEEVHPDHIIHTAAMSSVEACENDPTLCEKVNVETVYQLGQYCVQHDKHLVHLSTDFVFDGKEGPYKESDTMNPCNAYGESKVASETRLLSTDCRTAILRTILVYGVNGDPKRSNLVLWAKKQLEDNNRINVVSDQWRMPTFVDDLADACILAIEKEASGIYHISGDEMMSVLDAVYHIADFWQLDRSLINPIRAVDIGQENNRPRKTGFILDKAKTDLGYAPTPFIESLKEIEQQFSFYNR
ncbi:SDR family oxidoreductase [Sphingobacterium sp. DN00404]|uniref:dTDP-4-dehydrorhamnose reductase n=1 Tax=Sphingobacterium micropteri TaxID=2763501 RepID=A0ABR7YR78_9SPHI|nr:SDR family oxidoreductase [Sphingobacterium micropteri]MBD1433837.1 SDR family oxidoreductase [Sphingobacterium micropteri]